MKVSVIIPVALNRNADTPLAGIKQMDYPAEDVEMFLVYGNRPATQRNQAIKAASGEFIFFYDNDSTVYPDNFKEALKYFDFPSIGIVGGPSMSEGFGDNLLQKTLGYIVACKFAMFAMYARYTNAGQHRVSNEKELILCNMAIRKKALDECGLLNEDLYPNEENELVTRLSSKYTAIYDPDMQVSRKQRDTWGKFIKQFFTYGWGRMRHTLISDKGFSPVFLAPTFFTGYVLSLLIYHPNWYVIPLLMYIWVSIYHTIKIVFKSKDYRMYFLCPPIFLLLHMSYGVGVVCGLSRRFDLKADKAHTVINLRKIKSFGDKWSKTLKDVNQ